MTLPHFARWLPRESNANQLAGPRILLVTQEFPPRMEVGAARWEGFASYLVDAGWGVDVVIEDPVDLENPDWKRLERLPANLRVLGCVRQKPRWYQALSVIRGGAARAVEVNAVSSSASAREQAGLGAVFRQAMQITVHAHQARQLSHEFAIGALAIADHRHQLVVSSGPAHYAHVAAARVARERGLPHVVDLRDPWARTVPATTLERWLPDDDLRGDEAETLKRASLIITNTEAAREQLSKRFPELRDRVRCIPNGSDLAPLADATVNRTVFQIAHAGTLYLDRDPRPFLNAVNAVRNKLQLTTADIRVVFMGPAVSIGGRSLTELASDAGVGDLFSDLPPGTRDDARALLRVSTMAVAFQGATKTQIPAKVFEYMSFPLWMLALVGADSASGELLENTDAIVLEIDDESKIASAIEKCLLAFRAGELPLPIGRDGRFSRAKQAERLIEEFRKLVPRA